MAVTGTARTAVCLALAGAICFGGPAGCARKKAAVTTSGSAVATVNGAPITVEEFALEWNVIRGTAKGIAPMGETAAKALKHDLLDRMIERRLALAAARKRPPVGPEEVKEEIAEMRSGHSDDHFNALMVDGLMTHETLERRVRERLTVDRFFQEEVFKGLDADPREIEEYIGAHRQEFDRPERVKVQHIVVKTEEEIAHVRERLRAGEEFGDLARRFSVAPEAKNGGELPPYAAGTMPEVFDAAFRVPPGQVSEALPSPYGYHLFKVLHRYPAAAATAAEAEPETRLKVLEGKKRAARDAWLGRARAGAAIDVNGEILDAIP